MNRDSSVRFTSDHFRGHDDNHDREQHQRTHRHHSSVSTRAPASHASEDPAHALFDDEQWEAARIDLGLTPRELEIVKMVFDGHSEARIAWLLGISRHTVHTHKKNTFAKLQVSDAAELIIRIVRQHLYPQQGR